MKGFPGAKHKKFKTKSEAQEFALRGENVTAPENEAASFDVAGIHVFTDGAHSSKTKSSGIGIAAFTETKQILEISKGLKKGTTNQEAELTAISTALIYMAEKTEPNTNVTFWTDSDYSIKCLTDYIHKWRKNGWLTSQGDPVKHRNLIESR